FYFSSPPLSCPLSLHDALPISFVQQHLGWRASFWGVDILAVLCLIAVVIVIPRAGSAARIDLRAEIGAFRNGRLWIAYATNALRSEEQTSELQSLAYLVCRLLL